MENKKIDKTKIIIGVLILAVIVMAMVVVYLICFSGGQQQSMTNDQGLSLAENAENWDKSLEDLGNETTGIKIPGYGEIIISHNAKSANITLANPEGNPCYFEYTLKVGDSVLYKSDLIEPGKAIKEISLENVPDVGTYDLIFQINTYSLDESLSPMNGAEVKTTLVVT